MLCHCYCPSCAATARDKRLTGFEERYRGIEHLYGALSVLARVLPLKKPESTAFWRAYVELQTAHKQAADRTARRQRSQDCSKA